jgi:hypothetical protein
MLHPRPLIYIFHPSLLQQRGFLAVTISVVIDSSLALVQPNTKDSKRENCGIQTLKD